MENISSRTLSNMMCDRATAELTGGHVKAIYCHLCRKTFGMKELIKHLKESHRDFNFDSNCFLCGKALTTGHLKGCMEKFLKSPTCPVDFASGVNSTKQKNDDTIGERAHNTLMLATQVVLSYEPGSWFHLMIAKSHEDRFRNLVRGKANVWIPDFSCECRSCNLFGQAEEHVHLLLRSDKRDWTKAWKKVKGAKKYERIADSVHLTKTLIYCGQKCENRYAVRRLIYNEYLLWLINPVMILDDIHDHMQACEDFSQFDVCRNGERFTTPLRQITRQLKHFSTPVAVGRLELVDNITEDDTTLTWTPDEKFVNLLPGNELVTMTDVVDVAFPGEHYIWSEEKREMIEKYLREKKEKECKKEKCK